MHIHEVTFFLSSKFLRAPLRFRETAKVRGAVLDRQSRKPGEAVAATAVCVHSEPVVVLMLHQHFVTLRNCLVAVAKPHQPMRRSLGSFLTEIGEFSLVLGHNPPIDVSSLTFS